MAASSQENCGILDQSIPQWKRELILRRRALGRTLPAGNTSVKLTCPSVVTAVRHPELAVAGENVTGKQQRCISSALASNKGVLDQTQADFHPRGRNGESSSAPTVATSVAGNMRLVEHQVEGGTEFMINGVGLDITVESSSAKYRSKMGEEKSLKKSSTASRTIVDNCIVKNRLMGENNNCHAAQNEECDSDSSEELQYGPGIVNKLRCRYMSMTLRENQNKGFRPSLINMRRAASLENMLDNDNSETGKPQITAPHRFTKRTEIANNKAECIPQQQRYRPTCRSRNENVKRARSVETILRYEHKVHATVDHTDRKDVNKNNTNVLKALGNEEIVIVENKMKIECSRKSAHEDKVPMYHQKKRATNIPPETELPPPDVVKQTLKIFEGSPSKKTTKLTRAPGVSSKPTPFKGVSANVSKVNTTVVSEVKATPSIKPLLSPKPVLSPEKITQRAPSPRKQPAPLPLDTHQKLVSPTLNKSLSLDISSSSATSPIVSPTEINRRKSPPPTIPVRKIVSSPVLSRDDSSSEPTSLSPTPLTNGKTTFQESTTEEEQEEMVSSEAEEGDDPDSNTKSVSRDALENIRKGGATFQFNFGGISPVNKPKSYLPGAKAPVPSSQQQISRTQKVSSPAAERQGLVLATKPAAVAPLPISKSPESPPQTQMKQVGVIRPILSKSHPTSPPPPPLTDREIEKNLINRVKSIEQPTSKVVVSLKPPDNVVVGRVSIEPNRACVEESAKGLKEKVTLRCASESKASGLWDKKKPWNQQQNTMVFNFSDRKDPIPDYIENDGLILRSRREKPKSGESGIIFPEGGADESSTDFDDDYVVGCGSPPSPCNVQFENDNILINGRSNLLKQPKQQKLRITFNDAATSTFEYPSEASLLSEVQAPAASPAAPGLPIPPPPSGPTPGVPVPLGGSSLASYTPSKVHLGSDDFQLGVTRAAPLLVPAPSGDKTALSGESLSQEEEYLKPAEDGETVTWSSETAADLLF